MSSKTPTGYDPARSRVSEDRLKEWETYQGLDITMCPGIGPKAAGVLKEQDIMIVPHLRAKYESLAVTEAIENTDGEEEEVVDVVATNHHFWHYLQSIGINSFRSGIVNAINHHVATLDNNFIDNSTYGAEENEG